MWTWLSLTGAVFLSLTLGLCYFWFNKPGQVMQYLSRLSFFLEGFGIHKVRLGEHTYCYAERGHQVKGTPSLFLVHGFTASKEMWIPLLQQLKHEPNLHIVALDMPGHGDSSTPDDTVDISVPGMAKIIHEFVMLTDISKQPFHLVGLSLGGAVAGLYASLYPEQVSMLTLVCPAMVTPKETIFMELLRKGKCILLATTVPTMIEGFKSCMYYKENCPTNTQVMQGIIDMRSKHDDFFWKILKMLTQNMDDQFNQLMQHVSEIQMPSQVVWGEDDELMHVSGAKVLRKTLPDCRQCDVLPHCGHMPTIDCPHLLADCLLYFRHRVTEVIHS